MSANGRPFTITGLFPGALPVLFSFVVSSLLSTLAAGQGVPAPSAAELATSINLLNAASSPADAIEAYRQARESFPNVAALHRAYMVRMLRLGVLAPARAAAEKLVALDAGDGLAHAVLEYADGKAGRYPPALEHAIFAVQHGQTGEAVLTGLGQLLAWCEHQEKRPAMSPEAARALEEVREGLGRQRAFTRAHDAVARAYGRLDARRKEIDARLADLRNAMAAADSEYQFLGRQLGDASPAAADDFRNAASPPARTLTDTPASSPNVVFQPPGRIRPGPRPRPRPRPEPPDPPDDDPPVHGPPVSSSDVKAERNAINAQRAALRALADKLLAEYNKLRGERAALETSVTRQFHWDPPAVDGVVVTAPDSIAGLPPSPAPTPQDRAARDLVLARLHVENSRPDLAAPKLRFIQARYPGTPAAKDAATLLQTLDTGE